MNIPILSTYESLGGASIAALRLCKGLLQLKQNAFMIVKQKQSRRPYVYSTNLKEPFYEVEEQIFKEIQYHEINMDRTEASNTLLSFPYPGYDLTHTPVITNSQVINLHWVAGFQSVESIAALLKLGKPIIWTLHDENPFTGGCHYTAGCKKYQTDCSDCPQLNENPYDIPNHVIKNKINLWENHNNLTIVTPSKWLATCAKKSRVFKNLRVEVIPNSLETDIFKPRVKVLAKKKMGLSPESLILLFGAATGNEKRKGFYKLMAAMKYCLQDKAFKKMAKNKQIRIFTFGPLQEDMERLRIKIKSLGYIKDNRKLASIYSAADIFVLPSLEDNLPNTVLEAMACGTPVISFKVGGIPDMIEDGISGYMASPYKSQELGNLILKLLFNENKRKHMNLNCRQLIEKNFKLQDQAEGYLNLYEQLLADQNKKTLKQSIESETTNKKSKDRKIYLTEWKSDVHKDFFNLYRTRALKLLRIHDILLIHLKRLPWFIKWFLIKIRWLYFRTKRLLFKIRLVYWKILKFILWPFWRIRGAYRRYKKWRNPDPEQSDRSD